MLMLSSAGDKENYKVGEGNEWNGFRSEVLLYPGIVRYMGSDIFREWKMIG